MEQRVDHVFGSMTYRHSWEKRESFVIGKKKRELLIVAQAYKGQFITDAQREAYKSFKKEKNKKYLMALNAASEYRRKVFPREAHNDEIDKQTEPTTVLFQREGTWGILFDCDWDPEHGIAAMFDETGVKVGPSDILL